MTTDPKTAVPLVDALRAVAAVTPPGNRRDTVLRAVEELHVLVGRLVRHGALLNESERNVARLLVANDRLAALLTEARDICCAAALPYTQRATLRDRIDAALDGGEKA